MEVSQSESSSKRKLIVKRAIASLNQLSCNCDDDLQSEMYFMVLNFFVMCVWLLLQSKLFHFELSQSGRFTLNFHKVEDSL